MTLWTFKCYKLPQWLIALVNIHRMKWTNSSMWPLRNEREKLFDFTMDLVKNVLRGKTLVKGEFKHQFLSLIFLNSHTNQSFAKVMYHIWCILKHKLLHPLITILVFFLKDGFIKRKSKASWTCCIGETQTCCKEEGIGGHASETLNLDSSQKFVTVYIYRAEECN